MRIRPIAAALLIAFAPAAIAVPTPSFAQNPTDDALTAAARARFKEGVEAYDKKNYEAARAAFLQAYALKKHPDILFNLGQSCLRAGHTREAEKYFSMFLRDATNPAPEKKKEAEQGRDESRARLGRIEIVAASGTDVTVDNEAIGTTPLADSIVFVDPGAHTVKFKNGSETDVQSVSVLAGQQAIAKYKAAAASAPAPAPAPAPTPKSPEPASPPTPAPSSDEPKDTARHDETPPPHTEDTGPKKAGALSPPANMTPVYIGGVVALAGFGTAIAMLIAKGGAQSNADSVATQIRNAGGHQGICSSTNAADVQKFGKACAALNDDDNAVNADALVGNIALGVGVAALIGTGIYYLAAPKSEEKAASASTRPVLAPIVGPRIGGLSISGTF